MPVILIALHLVIFAHQRPSSAAAHAEDVLPLEPPKKKAVDRFEVGLHHPNEPVASAPVAVAPLPSPITNRHPWILSLHLSGALAISPTAKGGGLWGLVELGYRFAPLRRLLGVSVIADFGGGWLDVTPRHGGSVSSAGGILALSFNTERAGMLLRAGGGVSLDGVWTQEGARGHTHTVAIGGYLFASLGLRAGPGAFAFGLSYSPKYAAWLTDENVMHLIRLSVGYTFVL